MSFNGFVFCVSEVLFYYQVKIPKDILRNDKNYNYKSNLNFDTKKKLFFLRLLSTEPTWPYTQERELAYKRSAYTHMIAIHVIPSVIAVICMVGTTLEAGERKVYI
jgi:hypothetical protein